MEKSNQETIEKLEAMLGVKIHRCSSNEFQTYFTIELTPEGKRSFSQTFKPVEIYDVSLWSGGLVLVSMVISNDKIV